MIPLLKTKRREEALILKWTAEAEEDGLLLRSFLKKKHISKLLLTAIKHHDGGNIQVNNVTENVLYRVHYGDEIMVKLPEERQNEQLIAEHTDLDIRYEDEFVIVLNKPAGMPSIPSKYHPTGSVANFLKGHYLEQKLTNAIHIVTRLDRETSGLMLIAKTRFAHARLSYFLQTGALKRKYQALTMGHLAAKEGMIEAPIGRDSDVSIMARKVTPEGKYAKTNYRVMTSYSDFEHVAMELETGRTHQIRVHFSYIGHPLLGDDMYQGDLSLIKRHALHSYHLHFLHPFTEEYLSFESELPIDMQTLLTKNKK